MIIVLIYEADLYYIDDLIHCIINLYYSWQDRTARKAVLIIRHAHVLDRLRKYAH